MAVSCMSLLATTGSLGKIRYKPRILEEYSIYIIQITYYIYKYILCLCIYIYAIYIYTHIYIYIYTYIREEEQLLFFGVSLGNVSSDKLANPTINQSYGGLKQNHIPVTIGFTRFGGWIITRSPAHAIKQYQTHQTFLGLVVSFFFLSYSI